MASAVLEQLDRFGPDRCEALTLGRARDYTDRFTRAHGENFTVVSWFLPAELRGDFRNVYAFCRWADDLGDETGSRERSLELLQWWRDELDRCYQDRPRHPVFVALRDTVERHHLPRKPFDDLIDAFVQDQRVDRYQTMEQLLDYCDRSANPVGRLVLFLHGYRDGERQRLSDATCTALQLINFWQDVRRDLLERDRIYIPRGVAERHGLDLERMATRVRDGADTRELAPAYRAVIRELVEDARRRFEIGRGLWPLLRARERRQIRLFTLGGEAILRRVERLDGNTLDRRPRLGRAAKAAIMLRVLPGAWAGKLGLER